MSADNDDGMVVFLDAHRRLHETLSAPAVRLLLELYQGFVGFLVLLAAVDLFEWMADPTR